MIKNIFAKTHPRSAGYDEGRFPPGYDAAGFRDDRRISPTAPGRAGGLPRAKSRGFTLLELLIVIALLAILAVVVILVLNPAETLRKARDSQRISDLSTLKSALGLYLIDASSPDLDGGLATAICQGTLAGADRNVVVVWGGRPTAGTDVTDVDFTGGPLLGSAYTITAPSLVNATRDAILSVDSSGWVPVDLTQVSGGAPLGNLPVDPNFAVTTPANPDETVDRMYVYACGEAAGQFPYELNAVMEASANAAKEDDDGGNSGDIFEVGTDLTVISTW